MGKTVTGECETPGREIEEFVPVNDTETEAPSFTPVKTWDENLRPDPSHLLQPKPNKDGSITSASYVEALDQFKKSEPSDEDIARVCYEMADVYTAFSINRWRNEEGGYNDCLTDLGIVEGGNGISKAVGGGDLTEKFSEECNEKTANAIYNIHFVKKWKTTTHTVTESASHGANHRYYELLGESCDMKPDVMAKRIFGAELNEDDLARFQAVTGRMFTDELRELRANDGENPLETNFWHMVRIKWSKGEIQSRKDLALFTLDQMRRYT